MQYSSTTIPIQTVIDGSSSCIHVHRFQGDRGGPHVYMQANLHGPEIFGSALLIQLMQRLKEETVLQGKLTIVPMANPIGVRDQVYGQQIGRWNQQNGKNWNRIFSRTHNGSRKHTGSIEHRLASTLQELARDADIVLDIHTSGSDSIPHIYTTEEDSATFSSLGANVHIQYTEDDYCGAFDESMRLQAAEYGSFVAAATWEVAGHREINEDVLIERLENVLSFLRDIGVVAGGATESEATSARTLADIETMHAKESGYLVWHAESGDIIEVGEVFANLYQPCGEVVSLCADKNMQLLSLYGLRAVSQGQEIGKIIIC